MKCFYTIDTIDIDENTAVTVGKFDGLHLGHMELIEKAGEYKKLGLRTVVLKIEAPGKTLHNSILTTKEELAILEEAGVDYFVTLPFSEEFRSMSAEDFIREILVIRMHAKCVVTGDDFRFGAGRRGDTGLLEKVGAEYGIRCIVCERVLYGNVRVSSSRIREKLTAGAVDEAAHLLGRPYTIQGEIVHGRALGRNLGFPTINIYPEESRFLPLYGVYFTMVWIDDMCYGGMANIGVKPSISDEEKPVLEVHLLDVDEDLYGKTAVVDFVSFIRGERKFGSLDELKLQVLSDIDTARKLYCSGGAIRY